MAARAWGHTKNRRNNCKSLVLKTLWFPCPDVDAGWKFNTWKMSQLEWCHLRSQSSLERAQSPVELLYWKTVPLQNSHAWETVTSPHCSISPPMGNSPLSRRFTVTWQVDSSLPTSYYAKRCQNPPRVLRVDADSTWSSWTRMSFCRSNPCLLHSHSLHSQLHSGNNHLYTLAVQKLGP